MSNLNEKATRAASRYLEHRGYDILEEGWASPAGTSDIIATEGDTLVFVDVRAMWASRPSPRRPLSARGAR